MKVKLTEYQIKRVLELLTEEEDTKLNVMFVGDSHSAGPGWTWNYLIAKDHPEWNSTHITKGGKRTDWMLENLKSDLSKKKYDLVFIYGGANDVMSPLPITTPIKNIQKMVDLVNKQGGKAIVLTGFDSESIFNPNKVATTKYCDRECMIGFKPKRVKYQQELPSTITGAKVIPKLVGKYSWSNDGVHVGSAQHKLMKDHIYSNTGNLKNITSDTKIKISGDTETTKDSSPDSDTFLKGLWKKMFGIKDGGDVKTNDDSKPSETEDATEITPGERIVITNPGVTVRKYPSDLEQKMKNVVGEDVFNEFTKNLKTIGLDKTIAMRQLYSESAFSPDVVKCSRKSSAGAQGIAQFMPGTWPSYGTGSPCDPKQALRAYVKFMGKLMEIFPGRIDLAMAGYNSGPNKTAYKSALKNKTPFTNLKGKIPNESYTYASSILQP
jgi:lysophospholipase L1-like esterase